MFVLITDKFKCSMDLQSFAIQVNQRVKAHIHVSIVALKIRIIAVPQVQL